MLIWTEDNRWMYLCKKNNSCKLKRSFPKKIIYIRKKNQKSKYIAFLYFSFFLFSEYMNQNILIAIRILNKFNRYIEKKMLFILLSKIDFIKLVIKEAIYI